VVADLTDVELVGVVLAAGEGRRLRPLSEILAKALCPVGNVPLLDLALRRLEPVATDLAVNVHYHRDSLIRHLAASEADVHLSVEEPEALGTAGALGALRDWVSGRGVVVHNADAYLTEDLARLVHRWDGSRCRVLVAPASGRADFGAVRFVGVSLLPWAVVRDLRPIPSGLYEVVWRDAWAAGELDLVEARGPAVDCGTPSDYLRANLLASGGQSVIGPGARVSGEVVRSVVWPGAVVEAGERLVESIRAGAGLTVSAPL
jgi:N-acetyl-alpha-D-muramate 1-phosphate uridylyltransferase